MNRPINDSHPVDAELLAWKRELVAAMHAEGDSPDAPIENADLASAALVDESMVSRWRNPKCRDQLGVDHLVIIARTYPRLAARMLGFLAQRLGYQLSPTEGAPAKACDLRAVAKSTRSSMALADHMMLSLADNHLDPAERRAARALVATAKRDLDELDAGLASGESERPALRKVGA